MSKLPERAARAFPLLLLGLLAGLALLLDRITELPYFAPASHRSEPDLVIHQFAATGFGVDGKPQYLLNAQQMRHYPDQHAELENARLHRTEAGSAPMTVTAEQARITDRGQTVWFERAVVLHSAGDAKAQPMTVRTSQMQVDTRLGRASSDAAMEAETPGSRASALGFDYDHEKALLHLRAKVSIDYAPPKP